MLEELGTGTCSACKLIRTHMLLADLVAPAHAGSLTSISWSLQNAAHEKSQVRNMSASCSAISRKFVQQHARHVPVLRLICTCIAQEIDTTLHASSGDERERLVRLTRGPAAGGSHSCTGQAAAAVRGARHDDSSSTGPGSPLRPTGKTSVRLDHNHGWQRRCCCCSCCRHC